MRALDGVFMNRRTSLRLRVLTVAAAALVAVTPAAAAQAIPPPITECTAQWTTLAEWDEGYIMVVALTHDEPTTYWWSYFSLPQGHELLAH
jgi:ABC-type sugar transport system substrate-binding protein